MSDKNLASLFQVVADAAKIIILPHNNPDPDAIASAVALRCLLLEKIGLQFPILYQGIIGRAENRALVRYLGHPLKPATDLTQHQFAAVALVDTQPEAGNITLPPQSGLVIVIDHHVKHEAQVEAKFVDIRPELGATSTILLEYLQGANLEPDPPLATALFYGIKSNTMGLSRNVSPADTAAYFYLQSQIDIEALAEIERAQVPANYFKHFDAALRATHIYNQVVISYLGPVYYPDLTAEMADLLLRLEGSQWVICMGTYQDMFILSARTRIQQGGAGRLIRAVVRDEGTCGGHGTMAGGQIPLADRDPTQVASQLRGRILQYLKVPPNITSEPLV